MASEHSHPGAIDVSGRPYLRDARGALVPVESIKAMDLLIDGQVRKILAFAAELSAQVSRFKGHTFEDIGALQALVDQEYGAKLGGAKGNLTLTSFDGCMRVMLHMQDQLDFGPELQTAKKLVDECLSEWAADASANIRALVTRAFQVDKEGRINRAEIFMLLRVEIADERWQRAMDAVRDSIRVLGSKAYLRFQCRPAPEAAWSSITIDLAAA
ncbi:sulfate transporter [Rhodoblastus sphagnicola]|uniref:Sulfate transporter n=1 Tax=Rhodoblastus sphagnicola TaxID=333368 RepID=A0A2S6N2Y1_9HYPH|nr:DUF3164 family protein [Rhodoblastus sphagnicola]MBB4199092.1 hypothetical protein [Rhodoblastus sphagnicola]PPQ28984.1 sulfate transporter [Rhodoblastus sphagnicola]